MLTDPIGSICRATFRAMIRSFGFGRVMTEAAGRCNSAREGVFDHVDPAHPIDQRQIDAHIGQKPLGFSGQKFIDRRENPTNLPC
jgi:hypothetical protein